MQRRRPRRRRTLSRSTRRSSKSRPIFDEPSRWIVRTLCAPVQADALRPQALEEQNNTLLDKNASLEEDYEKVSSFKPLMDSYKSQLDALEAKSSSLTKDNDALRHELQRAKEKVARVQQEREKEGEALTLYEERVKELELDGKKGPKRAQGSDEDDSLEGVGGELDDAVTGTTMTDLKLKVRKLTRELEQAKANKADASRLVVLENLLDDSNRRKKRYEDEALKEHREKLALEGKLEEIMSGKSRLGDGSVLVLSSVLEIADAQMADPRPLSPYVYDSTRLWRSLTPSRSCTPSLTSTLRSKLTSSPSPSLIVSFSCRCSD